MVFQLLALLVFRLVFLLVLLLVLLLVFLLGLRVQGSGQEHQQEDQQEDLDDPPGSPDFSDPVAMREALKVMHTQVQAMQRTVPMQQLQRPAVGTAAGRSPAGWQGGGCCSRWCVGQAGLGRVGRARRLSRGRARWQRWKAVRRRRRWR